MPETRIGSAVASDLTNALSNYSVAAKETDSVEDQNETKWINDKWKNYFGYYKAIPELRAAIDAIATWTIGKGITADPDTLLILDGIIGYGKDTFNTILENMIRTMYISGDAFAEIIRDDEGIIINLKPLSPSKVEIVANRKGIIKRYEIINSGEENRRVNVENIFHLTKNRVADEIHGVSIIEALEPIILMRNEAMADLKEVFHRYVKPKFFFHLDTDDETKIAEFKSKMDAATGAGENMYIPKDAVVPENLSIAPNATLNPQPWIALLNQYFFQAARVPQIILGNASEFSEASAKIAYLAFQQNIEEEQLFIEEQAGIQLGIEIKLEFPASLENELISDKAKDGAVNIDAKETTATMSGNK